VGIIAASWESIRAYHELRKNRNEKKQKTKREKAVKGMEEKLKKIVILLALLMGPVLIFLSICLPWFVFAGTAEHARGTVEVSGSVSVFGSGAIDTNTHVTMWSSSRHWSSDGSDFWFGNLIIAGLIAIFVSVLFFMKKEPSKIFILLNLIVLVVGCLMVASASLIAILYYKPRIFVIFGQIDNLPSIDIALLYASQATISNGLGPFLSLFGSFLSITSAVPICYMKTRRR